MLDSPVPTARLEKFLDVETPASQEKADADTEPGEVPLKNDANVVTSKTNRSSTSGAIGTPRHMSIRGPDTPLNDTPKPKVSMSQRSQRSFRSRPSIPRQSMMKAPVTGSGSVHKDEMARKSWNRQRNTLLVLYMYVSFGISNGVMYAMFFLGYNREDSIVPSIGLATATASVLCGLWGLASVWYYSLPNVELFGRLFAPKHLLVRRPNFVRYSSIGNVVAINIVSHSVLWILPLILGNQYRDILDIIYLVTVAIAVLIFCVELYIICSLLTYCFHKLSKSAKQRARSRGSLMGTGIQASVLDDETEPPTPRTASVHQANFERQRIMFRSAKHTVHIIMWADKILGPLIFGLVMVAAILPGMRENMYLFFGGVVFLASMAAIVNIVVFLCRTTGPGYAKSDGASQGTRDPSHMDPL